jgi:hypothetical protein
VGGGGHHADRLLSRGVGAFGGGEYGPLHASGQQQLVLDDESARSSIFSGGRITAECCLSRRDSEALRIMRMWVEQSYKQVKRALGFSDFQVRSDSAIRRHWQLIFCAFSFCWWAYLRRHYEVTPIDVAPIDAAPQTQTVPEEAGGKRREDRKGASPSVMAGSSAAGAELAVPVGYAVALLEGVVGSAPAAPVARSA